MITAKLEEGTLIKTRNQCKYETSSIKEMEEHLKECGGVRMTEQENEDYYDLIKAECPPHDSAD